MINIKPIIYQALASKFDNVSDGYPESFAIFPAVAYTEENNSIAEYVDNKESKAYIEYKIDIWEKGSTTQSSIEVDKLMTALGLKRGYSGDLQEPELKHKIMRYSGTIDLNNMLVYHQ